MTSTDVRTRRAQRAHYPIDARPPSRLTRAATVALLCAFAVLSGCGPRVGPDAAAGVNLAGPWRLNRQASADPNALISAIIDKEMKHLRRRARANDEDPESVPGTTAGTVRRGPTPENTIEPLPPNGMFRPRGGIAAYLRSQYTNALGAVLNGDGLVIEQAPERFALIRGDSRRSFTPGGHSVVGVADGVADQTSGWNGHEYVIDVRPQVGPHVTERYGLGPGGQLVEKISLSGDDLPKLEFTRVYDRGAPPARALPTSD